MAVGRGGRCGCGDDDTMRKKERGKRRDLINSGIKTKKKSESNFVVFVVFCFIYI